ncbi:Sec-independent protein translocase subunit TatA/TatB [Demequina lignilytica]|uniref:Twin-arginine translocase TatA/TatE family subunit n=1 Tax=Demequina lignilytica TaxID=3051663 RepID=A0AAW7M2S8_9MICO|nr:MULTISPECIES: twin-arginine translocase TatA/TatE family subunit [unclassified Demequina]MDN4477685.1 twin-arginine translocase TatA/TatE family subunit [Demequina sp. SYSU T00039-1]MDN4482956.1 twin-arginine translocase TatA/TatE family subunit [Demequina sp. SYSU T0a273]MDN4487964.1 twin-arginine translocase TatA/TatE family subunit [Demequina sp. SYSU T00039]MDN4490404.1 twin-arginine translocase TatA/TatE family subunit [Demequina sp. SYSU T00068]
MLDINGGELLILVLVAIVVIGPERMPEYARQLREWVLRGRDLLRDSKASVKAEIGDDVDWSQLDPRQYDPRRIVRDALSEPSSPAPRAAAAPRASSPATPGKAPFDADAT